MKRIVLGCVTEFGKCGDPQEILQFSVVNFASFDTTSDFEEFDDYSSSGSFSSPEEDYGSVNNASEFTSDRRRRHCTGCAAGVTKEQQFPVSEQAKKRHPRRRC